MTQNVASAVLVRRDLRLDASPPQPPSGEPVHVIFSDGSRGEVAVFTPDAIAQMRMLLPAQSKEVVMDRLGISANTWLKIKRREPIRASIARGLAARISRFS